MAIGRKSTCKRQGLQFEWEKLTNDGTLVVLIGVESSVLLVGTKMVVWLLDHVAAVSDLALLKRALVDVHVRVVHVKPNKL